MEIDYITVTYTIDKISTILTVEETDNLICFIMWFIIEHWRHSSSSNGYFQFLIPGRKEWSSDYI